MLQSSSAEARRAAEYQVRDKLRLREASALAAGHQYREARQVLNVFDDADRRELGPRLIRLVSLSCLPH